MTFPAAPPSLEGVEHTDVVVDGVRWHVATAGDGPAIVLLHGWPQHWWMWRHVIGDLARTHRVIVPDVRGAGWSDAPAGDYTKAALAADVDRLLGELGVASAVVVGHDWGALIGWLLALDSPARVERLVALSNIHLWPKRTNVTPKAALSIAYQFPVATPVLGQVVQQLGAKTIGPLFRASVARGFHWDPQDVALYAGQYERAAHARAASALYRHFLTREIGPLLSGRYAGRRVEQPVLLATGRYDPVVTPARQEGGEEGAPNMRKAVLEGAGHFLLDERPEEVLRLIREELAA